MNLCLCGCGKEVNKGRKYINGGHSRRGKHISEEHKESLRQLYIGIGIAPNQDRTQSEETIQKRIKYQIGFKLSKDHKNKISKTRKKLISEGIITLPKGETHYNWNGGCTDDPYCDSWNDKDYKKEIYKRDNYKCLNPECKKKSKIICLHHIDYNKKDCSPKNLITVCLSCNAMANHNRRWHKAWYQAIMYRRYGV